MLHLIYTKENLSRGDSIKGFYEIFNLARNKENATVAVAVAGAPYVMEAANEATKLGIAKMILVGDESKIGQIAHEKGIDLSLFEVVNEPDPVMACKTAVSLVSSGKVSSLMKGDIDTSTVMRAALDKETGLRTGKKLSHMAAFETEGYHKMLFATDCAINIAPDFDTKVDIIENAVAALQNLGINKPKVALMAAKETVDDKMPVTQEWAKIVELHKSGERMQGCIVDGPLALDNAISEDACRIKGINSPVGADADILVAPTIEAGNMLYKCLSFITKAKNGGVVLGAKRPIVLTSRADTAESKLISIALSVLF
ncbi:MAG: bifunctional enoyl-CoA hydratase/phosphate acetyltransferase [Defluviitaleaceae bacterium]|nr:bifunctional enoyl-CoA hydratase/phosphate acetyltransferase [Defluviitaleaceae bacterium]